MCFGRPTARGRGVQLCLRSPAETNLERLQAWFGDGVLTVKTPPLRQGAKRSLPIEAPHLVNPVVTGL
jgi:hypothetical protein